MEKSEFHKVVLIIVIVLAVISTGWFVIKYQKTPGNVNQQVQEDDCFNLIGSDRSSCLSIKATKENNATICSSISDSTGKINCISNMALKNSDISICDLGFYSLEEYSVCINKFVEQAIQKEDISICGENPLCIFKFANSTKDDKICEKLDSENTASDLVESCKRAI